MAITAREQEVLDHYRSGLSHSQIAQRMRISPASVKRMLGLLSDNPILDRRVNAAIAHGSQQLRDAVLAQGGHR